MPAVTVSVIIPAYGVSRYIGDAVRSVLEQTYTDYEVIVIDQDRSAAMTAALAPFSGRIVHLRKEPTNVSAARNYGIRHARGRYIALLDGDDCWYPNFLERLVPMLESPTEPDVVYPNMVFFGRRSMEGELLQDLYPSKLPVDFLAILSRESLVSNTAVMHAKILQKVDGYDESLSTCEDFDLWLRIAAAGGRFEFTNEPLARYRQRPDSLSGNSIQMHSASITVCAKYRKHPDPAVRQTAEAQMKAIAAGMELETAKALVLARSYSNARALLRSANRYYGRVKLHAAYSLLLVAPSLVRRTIVHSNRRLRAEYS